MTEIPIIYDAAMPPGTAMIITQELMDKITDTMGVPSQFLDTKNDKDYAFVILRDSQRFRQRLDRIVLSINLSPYLAHVLRDRKKKPDFINAKFMSCSWEVC